MGLEPTLLVKEPVCTHQHDDKSQLVLSDRFGQASLPIPTHYLSSLSQCITIAVRFLFLNIRIVLIGIKNVSVTCV